MMFVKDFTYGSDTPDFYSTSGHRAVTLTRPPLLFCQTVRDLKGATLFSFFFLLTARCSCCTVLAPTLLAMPSYRKTVAHLRSLSPMSPQLHRQQSALPPSCVLSARCSSQHPLNQFQSKLAQMFNVKSPAETNELHLP